MNKVVEGQDGTGGGKACDGRGKSEVASARAHQPTPQPFHVHALRAHVRSLPDMRCVNTRRARRAECVHHATAVRLQHESTSTHIRHAYVQLHRPKASMSHVGLARGQFMVFTKHISSLSSVARAMVL